MYPYHVPYVIPFRDMIVYTDLSLNSLSRQSRQLESSDSSSRLLE